MKIQIYTAYHAWAPLLKNASVVPIHVGRARAATPLADMIGDDTGVEISAKNDEFCELTALYWAWKNDTTSDYIGLMHYRRVLDFDHSHANSDAEVFPRRFDIPSWLKSAQSWMNAELGNYDIILPCAHRMGRSVSKNYVTRHAPEDWDATRAIIARDHADYLPAFDRVAKGRDIRLANMAVMSRPLMDRYCTWLFDVLFKLEATDIDRSCYNARQLRYLGFVSERLFTVFIDHLQHENPDLRLREVNIINTKEALVTPYINDDSLNGPEHVNIAFSTDRAYAPHAAAMLQSMLTRADRARQINLFLLQSDVGDFARDLLGEVVGAFENVKLHIISADPGFDNAYRSPSRAPSNATYNRFSLFELLPTLDRLLYVDVDMIFRGDVCEIFDADLGDAQLGAVTDYIMTRVLTGPTPTADPDVPDLYEYYSTRLGMSDAQIERYFNAGLLLFNFKAMDVIKVGRELLEMAHAGRYLFRDQDVLNLYFKDSFVKLDDRYNVFNTVTEGYNRVPAANHALAMAARRDPILIHYAAGDYKPWKRSVPMGQHYWHALTETPFYYEVMRAQSRRVTQPMETSPTAAAGVVKLGRTLADKVPALRPALLKVHRALQRITP